MRDNLLSKISLLTLMCIYACSCSGQPSPTTGVTSISINNVSQIANTKNLTGDGAQTLEFSPNGKLLAVAYRSLANYSVLFWDTTSWQSVGQISSDNEIGKIHFSPDGNFFVIVTKQGIADLWDISSTSFHHMQSLHTNLFVINDIFDAAIIPKLNYIATAAGGTLLGTSDFKGVIQFWDLTSGAEKDRWIINDGAVVALSLSHNGNLIVLGLGSGGLASLPGVVLLRYTTTGNTILTMNDFPSGITDVEFADNDSLLAASSSDGTIQLWDISKKQRRSTFHHGIDAVVTSISFNANSTLLASAGTDGIIRLWDISKGNEIGQLKKSPNEVNAVKFSPNNLSIVSANLAGPVNIWTVK